MTTTKNDDLLILSDDATSLDFGVSEELESKSEKKLEDDAVISLEDDSKDSEFSFAFDEDKTPKKETVDFPEDDSVKDSLEDLSKNIGLDPTKSEKQEEKPKKEESLLDFGLDSDSKKESKDSILEENIASPSDSLEENKVEVSENNLYGDKLDKNPGDMSEILLRAISEFEDREHLIEDDISDKENHISTLKKELSTEEELVSDLKSEKEALEKNRKSLEKMKSDFENKDEKSDTRKISK